MSMYSNSNPQLGLINNNYSNNSELNNFKQSKDKNLNNLVSTPSSDSNSNLNGPWMNGSLSMSSSTPPSVPKDTFTTTATISTTSEADVLNSSSPLAFNGNTYVRPNKKERKGLYFSEGSSSSSLPSSPEIQGPTSGTHPGDKKTKTDVMDENATTTNTTTASSCNKIPSLKFSSPSPRTSSTSASVSSPDEDTLELSSSNSAEEVGGDQKLISFHNMTNPENQSSGFRGPLLTSTPTKGSNNINHNNSNNKSSSQAEVEDFLGKSNEGSSGLNNNFNSRGSGGGHPHHHHLRQNDHSNHDQSHSLSNTSTEENFECFGEGSESFSIVDSNTTTESNSLQNFRDLNESDILSSPGGDGNPPASLSRQGWQRTSLRRTPNPNNSLNGDGMNHRRWGSFRSSTKRGVPAVPSSKALANELYRSSSYHSSGRSSAGDGEEMYSDSSLEGEVIDLTKKVHHLEEKFTVLAENQNDVDDRYTRAKQENAELSTKLFMFEEQLREVELRADEKLRDEQRRHKEALSRFEREKQLQIENYEIKSQMLEKDLSSSKIEVKRLEGTLERERNEKNRLGDKYANVEREISSVREQNRELLNQNRIDRETMAMESAGSQQALVELKKQLEGLSHFHLNSSSHSFRRNDSTESESSELKSRLREADEEIRRLKQQNKQLQETNEELSAQILNQGLENGRNLLKELNTSNGGPGGNSLAAEFEAMSMEETDEYGFTSQNRSERDAMSKMKSALKDQKEANLALRSYIDGILLNIVEHYPQLLEVKNKNSSLSCHQNGITSSDSK